jgi:hypothetical protein
MERLTPEIGAVVQTTNSAVTLARHAIQEAPEEARLEFFSDAFATGSTKSSIFSNSKERAYKPKRALLLALQIQTVEACGLRP